MEGDASSASYFLAGATITGGTVTVEGCGSDSLQVRVAAGRGLDCCCDRSLGAATGYNSRAQAAAACG